MCTVTYIPAKDGFYITSNRDENIARNQAFLPDTYQHQNGALLYPKDAAAGGTWIAVNYNGNCAVLLNGAFSKHISQPPYKKSRGLIFTDIIDATSPFNYFSSIDLTNIEPFTIILFEHNNLYECRWDGNKKFQKTLNKQTPQIWSSATLYSEAVIKTREAWFQNWLNNNPIPTQNEIMKFHQFNGNGDVENAILMNRENTMLTVSITGIFCNEEKAELIYIDLHNKTQTNHQINFVKASQS